ncbi:putative metal-dependent HD superfamily phosphohydrolase [Paraburkholderia sp. HC6.4b]|uniref:hypothetical protein n=1 Tax=unclassified Paraburkholderia TaxID=2615204 RepID=UPI00161D4E6D|nr:MULTISPECIES: hypothetical protein [unclassified Paraburkholderia]MBB5409178.1 putative metal-dependent HD superfamily phosphohydrolase [Paraburkholderia sp. HC6.4b]MBB5450906.1 putative metal-dependent HD superfamily phosphohydrolase [Paraburkholderia sp. Kb1A]
MSRDKPVSTHQRRKKSRLLALPDYAENESRSAQWLAAVVREHCSGNWRRIHAEHVLLAGYFIVATKLHRVPEQLMADLILRRATQLFLDADLAILAAPATRLLAYDREIAREWGQDPDAPSEAFRAGRLQALQGLQQCTTLFGSVEFADLEPIARANLDRLVQQYARPG